METILEERLTVEEFWAQYGLQDARYELVKGIPVEMPPPSFEHSEIAAGVTIDLGNYVRQNDLGRVLVECDIQLDEDTVRRPDVAFITTERLALIEDRTKFAPIPPDLAIEVVSPSETATTTREKVGDYLKNGTKLVWVAYPKLKEVVVHYPDGSAQTLTEEDTLSGGDVLPGFELPVAQIFEA